MTAIRSFVPEIMAGAIAFGLTVILVPVVRTLCLRWCLFDAPGPLKIHSRPIPRLGGIAVAIAISTVALFASGSQTMSAWTFFAALAVIWAVGLADDLRGVSPVFRLAVQFAAGALLWTGAWRVPMLGSGALDLAATAMFVAAMANSVNLLDGMDGVAAGVVAIISAAYVALPDSPGNPFVATVACSLAGACTGFLLYNWHPSKIFLGDSGSTVLGFGIAFLGLDLYRSHPANSPALLFPLLTAGIPLLDAIFALLRRLRRRISPFRGDRCHGYDLLGARGWPVRRIALAFYGSTATLAALAVWGVRRQPPKFCAVAGVTVGVLVLVAVRLGALRAGDRSLMAPDASGQPTDNLHEELTSTD